MKGFQAHSVCAVLMVCFIPVIAKGQVITSTPVVATGMTGSGTGTAFDSIDHHFSLVNGEIAFVASTTPSMLYDHGIWTTSNFGLSFQLPIFDQQTAPNSSTHVFAPGNVSLSASGAISFSDIDMGINLWTTGAGLTNVATQGAVTPGTANHFNFPWGQIAINSTGGVAFNDGGDSSTSGVWTNAWGNGLQLVAITGGAVPGGATYVGMNSDVHIGGTTIVHSATVNFNSQNVTALISETPTGSRLVMQQNAAVASMPGYTYGGINPIAVNSSGHVAFTTTVSTTGSSKSVVMLDTGSGPQPVVVSGQTPPGLAQAFSQFGTPVMNDNDTVAFVGTTSSKQGLFTSALATAAQLVVAKGQTAPSVPGGLTFNNFGDMALGNTGTLGFLVQLADPNNVNNNPHGLFVEGPDGVVHLVAYEGEVVPIGPGLGNGTIQELEFASSFWMNNQAQAIDGNTLAYRIQFTNGNTGIYTATATPEPGSLSILALASLGLVARRR